MSPLKDRSAFSAYRQKESKRAGWRRVATDRAGRITREHTRTLAERISEHGPAGVSGTTADRSPARQRIHVSACQCPPANARLRMERCGLPMTMGCGASDCILCKPSLHEHSI